MTDAPLTEPFSMRLSEAHRAYMKEQRDAARDRGLRISEGDVLRAMFEHCRRTGFSLVGDTDEEVRA